jgi:hypothetical protein
MRVGPSLALADLQSEAVERSQAAVAALLLLAADREAAAAQRRQRVQRMPAPAERSSVVPDKGAEAPQAAALPPAHRRSKIFI